MITNNLRKLLAWVGTHTGSGSSIYGGIWTNNVGSLAMRSVTGSSDDLAYAYRATLTCNGTTSADMMGYGLRDDYVIIKTASTSNKNPTSPGSNYSVANRIAVTYDENDIAVSASDTAMAGTDIGTSNFSTSMSGGIRTITISNSTSNNLSFNRIGVFGVCTISPTGSTYHSFLTYIFAFPTVTLAPGESKSYSFAFMPGT